MTHLNKFKFFTGLKVRYEETDAMSVVYYGKYFIYFEVARTEYLKNIGYNYAEIEKEGYYFVVAESNCVYSSPARYDDDLKIYARVEYIRNSSFKFIYRVIRESSAHGANLPSEIAAGSTVLVCVSKSDFKPRRIPEHISAAVKSFEEL